MVDDYLKHLGYFTRHNVKFKPRNDHSDFVQRKDSNPSDIDVIGVNPLEEGEKRVVVASCKSWQGGFNPVSTLREIAESRKVSGREAWMRYRELVQPKWSEAFVSKIESLTGSRRFEYWTVVTRLSKNADVSVWEENVRFKAMLFGNSIRIVTFGEILGGIWSDTSKTPASSNIGRILQLMRASGWMPKEWICEGKSKVIKRPL